MSVRGIERLLEQWEMGVKDAHRRVILSPTPRERERWHAVWLLAQGWTASAVAEALERDPHTIGRWAASAVAEALERDPHTIGRWAAAFGEGGPAALIFEQTGGSPPPSVRRNRRC